MPRRVEEEKEFLLLPGEAELMRAKRAAQRAAPYNPRRVRTPAPTPKRTPTIKATKAPAIPKATSKKAAKKTAFGTLKEWADRAKEKTADLPSQKKPQTWEERKRYLEGLTKRKK